MITALIATVVVLLRRDLFFSDRAAAAEAQGTALEGCTDEFGTDACSCSPAGSTGSRPTPTYSWCPTCSTTRPTARPDSGGRWRPCTRRIAGLTMLNNVGVRWLNHLTVIDFSLPEEARDGTETLAYSFRLKTEYTPPHYKKDLGAITQPLLVIAGTADEAVHTDQYEPVISQYTLGQVQLLDRVTRMGSVVDPAVHPVVRAWLGNPVK